VSRAVRLSRTLPYAPEAVWEALTDRRQLGEWMAENDFEPRVGHRFELRTGPRADARTGTGSFAARCWSWIRLGGSAFPARATAPAVAR
jgi:uncharacterized protein YndB with AHSA1/START domain